MSDQIFISGRFYFPADSGLEFRPNQQPGPSVVMSVGQALRPAIIREHHTQTGATHALAGSRRLPVQAQLVAGRNNS